MNDKIEEPQRGGSYIRNADGSLSLVQSTEEAPQRDKRDDAKTVSPAVAPAKPAKPAQE